LPTVGGVDGKMKKARRAVSGGLKAIIGRGYGAPL
jgi:hypothetical protein